jgi:hypothetical protein
VTLEARFIHERLVANGAFIVDLASVGTFVLQQGLSFGKCLATVGANERISTATVSVVNVLLHFHFRGKRFAASGALVEGDVLIWMIGLQMRQQILVVLEGRRTQMTSVCVVILVVLYFLRPFPEFILGVAL